jgi:hypothetical protein
MSTMSFRAIDAQDDWQFGNGRGSYFQKEDAVNANVRTRLLFFLNDCFWAMNFGIDWVNLLGSKNPASEQGIILQTRTGLTGSFGVTKILSVDVTVNARTRALTLTYAVNTIFSTNVINSISPGG